MEGDDMTFLAERSTREKYTVLFGVFVVAWLFVGLLCAMMVYGQLGHWIELFNGATWPKVFTVTPADGETGAGSPVGFWFYLVLSLRTLLNLGLLLSAVLALCWFVAGGFERMVMKRIDVLSNMRDAALVGVLLEVLEKAQIVLPENVEDELYAAAQRFDGTPVGRSLKRRREEAQAVAR